MPYPVIALVGYTNAGKSTLFNALTGAGVYAQDQLFATLDPTMRGIRLPSGRRAILSDTVGFICDLPTELVEAFRATLEEVARPTSSCMSATWRIPTARRSAPTCSAVLRRDGERADAPLDEGWPSAGSSRC